MGTDPSTDDYEPGDQCENCKDLLFGGITPKYVEVDISGIEKCPDVIQDLPNGTFLLTQTVNPCLWQAFTDVGVFVWELRADDSRFHIIIPDLIWFNAIVPDTCIDAFVNTLVCGDPGVLGESGYALCYWGPTIGP